MTMNYQAESNAVEIKRLRDCYAELSKLHQADRRLDEQRIDTLRARVAKLEAALESVCVALLPHDSRCQNVNAVFEAHDRARAALKGE
jgi:cob(I)alamin adenosyltransferase